jgi:hypothetical protein
MDQQFSPISVLLPTDGPHDFFLRFLETRCCCSATHLQHLVIRPIRRPFRVRDVDNTLQILAEFHGRLLSVVCGCHETSVARRCEKMRRRRGVLREPTNFCTAAYFRRKASPRVVMVGM